MASSPQAHVLVVDDEWIVAKDVQRCLQQEGYDVPVIAGSAREALAAVEARRPDLALLDIALGGELDGTDLARQLASPPAVPVVYLTAHSDRDTLERAAGPTVMGYLVKPFEPRQLRVTVSLALIRWKHEQQLASPARTAALEQAFAQIGDLVDSLRMRFGVGRAEALVDDERLAALEQLSRREWEILRELNDNHRVPAIAGRLAISQHTVRNHLKAIYRKLGVSSQAELIELTRGAAGAGPGTSRAVPAGPAGH